MADTKEVEHLLTLKVMRLSRPTFHLLPPSLFPILGTRPKPGSFEDDFQIGDIPEDLGLAPLLILPQSFGNIYLGETFTCYVRVHNESEKQLKNVNVRSDLQTSSQRFPVGGNAEVGVTELQPSKSIDRVIQHEVKELGNHILVCSVAYEDEASQKYSFKKYYKFAVAKPLDVKTKFYNAESEEVYLEAQVENITTGPICLEKVHLEPSPLYSVESLNTFGVNGESIFGEVNVLGVGDARQFLFCLKPKPQFSDGFKGSVGVGKLDIEWRSSMGEKGRLQTSQLQRMVPVHNDVRVMVEEIPGMVKLEESFLIVVSLHNESEKAVELSLRLVSQPSSGLKWLGALTWRVGCIPPKTSKEIQLPLVATLPGLQTIPGLCVIESVQSRTFSYDDLAQVFVT